MHHTSELGPEVVAALLGNYSTGQVAKGSDNEDRDQTDHETDGD